MTKDEIQGEWNGFIEYPKGSKSTYVTTTSALLFAEHIVKLAELRECEACAKVCDEMGVHWSGYKDTALLNGDIELSNAASGEPRAAESLARLIRARGNASLTCSKCGIDRMKEACKNPGPNCPFMGSAQA
jgi:hypothetical protein